MVQVMVVKQLAGLHPADEQAEKLIRSLKLGEMVSVEIKRPRNVAFHAKFFRMLRIIFDNQEHYKSIDDLLEVLKLRIGHCHTIDTKFGEVKITDSINFAALDNVDFSEFYDRACAWVIAEVIPGLDRLGLDKEVREQLQNFGSPEG